MCSPVPHLEHSPGLSLEGWASRRGHLLAHAVVFVLGFSLLFVLTGAAATALGRALSRQLPLLQRLGGIALVVLGLHLTGVIRLPFLMRERSLRGAANPGMGYAASFLTGVFLFWAGFPVGPVSWPSTLAGVARRWARA